MKRLFTSLLIGGSFCMGYAQTYLYENFNNYDGTAATTPAGWYFSYHGNYTTNASSGPSTANSYKFGADGAYIISPMVMNGDSVSFYMKLNGSGNMANDTLSTITVMGSPTDTAASSFSIMATFRKISTASTLRRYALARGNNMYIKIMYTKVGGNVAFDDFAVYSGVFVGSNSTPTKLPFTFDVFPNPSSNGFVNVKIEGASKDASLTVYNIVGKAVISRPVEASGRFLLDLSDLPKGVYLLSIKNNEKNEVRKIRIE